MSSSPGDRIRRIAAFHGFGDAGDAALQEVALWIARRFQLLAEHATDVISVHDAEGRIEYVSPSASRVVGRDPAELVGELPFELAHPDHREALREALGRLLAGEDVPDQIFRAAGPEDEVRWLEVSGRVVEHEGERRMVAVTRDVTRRRRLEDAAARSRRLQAVGRLAGGVAHNLNNRLMTVKGELMLLDEDLDRDDHRRALRRMDEAIDRAADLVQGLLTLGGVRAGQMEIVDLARLLDELRPRLRGVVTGAVELDFRLPEEALRVEGDREGLEAVIRILVENADEAVSGGGRITVSAEARERLPEGGLGAALPPERGPWALLTVSDTGPGVDPAVRDRIFEPFTSGSSILEKRGMGLAVAHRIVRELDGAIAVDSADDEGARVEVALPLV